MFKKKTSLVLMLLALSLLVGCTSKWNQPDPNMPEELKQQLEQNIEENTAKLSENAGDIDAQFNVAFAYQELGNFRKAIDAYNAVLVMNPNYATVYNNMATIYESMEDYQQAAASIKKCYELKQDDVEVINDTVRILLEAGDPDNAQHALENFTKLAQEDDSIGEKQAMISELYTSISNYRQENGL